LLYEFFRLSVPGLFFVIFFGATGSPWIAEAGASTSTLAATLVGAVLTSPSLGYAITQLMRFLYALTGRRPNATYIETCELRDNLSSMALPSATTQALRHMRPKNLHRLIWVSHADQELRKRSESYWERFYANEAMLLASGMGGLGGFILTWVSGQRVLDWRVALIASVWFSMLFAGLAAERLLPPARMRSNGLKLGLYLATLLLPLGVMAVLLCSTTLRGYLQLDSYSAIALAALTALWLVVVVTNWAYLRIAVELENTWIHVFLSAVKEDPSRFNFGVRTASDAR